MHIEHLVAYIVIGIVVGYAFSHSAVGSALLYRVGAALAAALVVGEITQIIFGESSVLGKYGSILFSLVAAAIVAFLFPKPAPAPKGTDS